MNTLETLVKARELICNPENWTQGAYARDAQGYDCSPRSDKAVKFCAIGAIIKSSSYVWTPVEYIEAPYDESLSYLNDTSTHEKVLTLFDSAIEKLTKEKGVDGKD